MTMTLPALEAHLERLNKQHASAQLAVAAKLHTLEGVEAELAKYEAERQRIKAEREAKAWKPAWERGK